MSIDTKEIICDKFFELLSQYPADKITVKMLVEYCHISRQSFYYHFTDIFAVTEYAFAKLTEKMREEALACHEDTEQALTLFLENAQEHIDIFEKLSASSHDQIYENILARSVRELVDALAKSDASKPAILARDYDLSLDFITYGLIGMLKHHLKKDTDVKEMAAAMSRVCQLNDKTI